MADRNGIVQRAPLPPLNSPLINEADRARVSVESSATSGRLAALAGIDPNNPRQTFAATWWAARPFASRPAPSLNHSRLF
jgi:hypothetical protein